MTKSKIAADGWPQAKNEPLDFDALAGPLMRAVQFCYNLERRNHNKSVPWKGPNIGSNELACCLPAKEKLSAKNLAYSEEDQGRDPLQEIIGLAIQLGIEQGRRIMRSSPEYCILTTRAASDDFHKGIIDGETFGKALRGDYDVFA